MTEEWQDLTPSRAGRIVDPVNENNRERVVIQVREVTEVERRIVYELHSEKCECDLCETEREEITRRITERNSLSEEQKLAHLRTLLASVKPDAPGERGRDERDPNLP